MRLPAKLMKQAAAVVAGRVNAHPSEILACMQAEWLKYDKAKKTQFIAYLKEQTA